VIDVSSGEESEKSNTYVGLHKRRVHLEFAEFWSQNAMKREKEIRLIVIWKITYFFQCQKQNLMF